MSNTLEALFQSGLLPITDFPPESRYHGVPVRQLPTADGAGIAYLARRFAPSPERFSTLSVHIVAQGERLDRIAARLIGDPEQYWSLCDSNGIVWPDDLEVPETRLRVTLPADLPGPGEAP